MQLAIFDLDYTLVPFDTDKAWNKFLIELGVVNKEIYHKKNERFYQDYLHESLDIRAYQRFACEILQKFPICQVKEWRAKYLQDIVMPQLQTKALKCIQDYKADGYTTLIISATNTFIVEPIAALHDVDAYLGCEFEIKEGLYTGELIGIPTYQEGKVNALNEWLSKHNAEPETIHFYSDSINDRPLLELADKAYVINPDELLAKLARKKGWPKINLFD